jgi:hypothetical protein
VSSQDDQYAFEPLEEALDVRKGSTSTAVKVFKPVAFIVGVGLLVFAVGAFAGLGPPPG